MINSFDFHQMFIRFTIAFVPAVIGIVFHEVAHGYAAYRLGDPTAKTLGRLTLNPIKHVDPMGLFVFIFTALLAPFVIGWAKPVPVQSRFFKQPRESMMLVALAGPFTNFALAVIFALIAVVLAPYAFGNKILFYVFLSAQQGVYINCALAWFNLMPIPPLDGSHVVFGLLPRPLAAEYAKIGKYGFIIILFFLYFNLFGKVLGPLIFGTAETIFKLFSFFSL